jgi:hypothetical protein
VPAYTPSFKVEINGVDYKNDVVEEVTITKGRNDIFAETLAGYCLINIVNLSGASPVIELNDVIVIKTTDSTNADFTLFTGQVASVTNQLTNAGSVNLVNNLIITGLGSLSKLVRRTAGAALYPEELDGARIQRILEDALFLRFTDLPNTLDWDNVDPAQTWADFGVQDIDVVDPGRFEILERAAGLEIADDIARRTELSGLGYLYEANDGSLGYADANRRTDNIGNNAINLDADLLLADLSTRLAVEDIINNVLIRYDDPTDEVEAVNDQSVEDFGLLQFIRDTELAQQADAEEQATRFVSLRGTPAMSLDEITINLTNPNMSDDTRDKLLNISLDTLLIIDNLPIGIYNEPVFEGFVEGYTWRFSKNTIELEASVSNYIFSAFDVQWQNYNATTQWQNLSNDLQWSNLAIG